MEVYYADQYAVLLEGARWVGKSTMTQHFGENILRCFDDIGHLDLFFLRLQAETGITLYDHQS